MATKTTHLNKVSNVEVNMDGDGKMTIAFDDCGYPDNKRVVIHAEVWLAKYITEGIAIQAKKFYDNFLRELLQ